MEPLPIGLAWRFASWLPSFLLRWFFPRERLARLVDIDLRPRHDPVTIYGGESPEIHIWIVLANRGYFSIELDRLTVEITAGAVVTQLHHLRRTQLLPNQQIEIFVRGSFTAEQTRLLAIQMKSNSVEMQFFSEFNSKIHDFSVSTGRLAGINSRTVNL